MSMLTSLFVTFAFGQCFITKLSKLQSRGQPIRDDGPDTHLKTKIGTPTMGGLLILSSLALSVFLWSDILNPYLWITMLVTYSFGLLGFLDDYLKIKHHNSKGLPGRYKLLFQFFIAIVSVLAISYVSSSNIYHVHFPFLKYFTLELGVLYIIFAAFVITGSSNAVNLTDGLDGLAIGPVMIVAGCFALLSYVVGNALFTQYLKIEYVAKSGELTVFCAALVGAGLGFLWYNAPPAQIFMGDVGSLALGGAIGVISVIIKQEILLVIIGGIFVVEALSVIIQVLSFKIRGKRVFRMAPIHHHFEKIGWSESKIVIRFWILSLVFAVIGLATLKLR